MSVKKQLLDPLGTLCKLISLNFSELNTKISIQNHTISLHKPYNYQFMLRMINGDGRENISELFHIILQIINWYLVVDNYNDTDENWEQISKSEEIHKLVNYACCALRKLQETYEFGNVVLAIQYYINILEDANNGTYTNNKLPQSILNKENNNDNLLDYEKLKNFWDYKKLKRICNLYDDCFNVHTDILPLNEKNGLIDGYLKSINAILELTDIDFHKLLSNSNKG